jgi:hypothetical protein
MRAYVLWTVCGPQIILTSYDLANEPENLKKIADTGFEKFIAFEISAGTVKARYGEHFTNVITDPEQTDDLRILDSDPERVMHLFHFTELGKPIFFEAKAPVR